MSFDQQAFDAGLDEYQATLAEQAYEASRRSYLTAARPDAEPLIVTFDDLRPGDYMTNEGPDGRWVKIVELRGPSCNVKRREQNRQPQEHEISVLFEIPEAVTVSGERRYWIERPRTDEIMIDASVRQ